MQIRRTTGVVLTVASVTTAAIGWVMWRTVQTTDSTVTVTAGRAAKKYARSNPFLPSGVADRGWPFLRGPDFDGRSAELRLADDWPSTGPPVLWTRTLGQGYSAFVAAEDRILTQYQSLAGQFVICLNADTGETIWEYRYDWPYEVGGVYPGPRATPTINGRRIYFAAPSGLVGCLSWDGKPEWQVATREKFGGKGADFGYSCSPTVDDGVVLLPVGGVGAAMVALDALDGSTCWQSGDDAASYMPALPVTVEGHRQVIGYFENSLCGFDRDDGRLLWRREQSQGYDEHAAWPVYVEPHLWISAPFRWGSTLLRLSGGEPAAAAEIWHSNLLSNDIFSSVCSDGALYGFDLKDVQAKLHRPSRGVFRCLDLETGAPHWESDATGHANVLIADGKLILFNDKGELILARANPDRYEELARASVLAGEICWTPPALDRGRLYVRNQRRAVCVYIGRPDLLEQRDERRVLTVSDIPQSEYYDLASILGIEPEYAFDVPSAAWLQNWYLAGLGILAGAGAVAIFLKLGLRLPFGEYLSSARTWAIFQTVAFVAAVVATTPLSLWRNEFVFTWPVSLFVVFQATVDQVQLTRRKQPGDSPAWRSWLVLLTFLVVCVGYYLACHRLSLVFEWVFLIGFGAALPVALAARWLTRRAARPLVWNALFTAFSFSAYYWSSVAWLWWKYPER
jgi:outer membrane protein assembly factor BamB